MKKSVPFIIITGYGDKSNAIRALKLGAYDFIEKPLKNKELENVVAAAVQVSSEMRALENQMIRAATKNAKA